MLRISFRGSLLAPAEQFALPGNVQALRRLQGVSAQQAATRQNFCSRKSLTFAAFGSKSVSMRESST
jgi:hypothetical protein